MVSIRKYILDNPTKWAEDADNPAFIMYGRGMA